MRARASNCLVALTATDCHNTYRRQALFGRPFGLSETLRLTLCGSLWQFLPQMNTNSHEATETPVNPAYEAEVRARCSKWMKAGVAAVAADRELDDADIVREAVLEYLANRGIKKPQPQPEHAAA